MPEKREWRQFDSNSSDLPKSGSRRTAGNPVHGLFAKETQETQVMKSGQRNVQFITRQVMRQRSVRSLRNCPLSRKRNTFTNINVFCLVFCRAID